MNRPAPQQTLESYTMNSAFSEANLIIEAKKILGQDADVLAAGRFNLASLVGAAIVGSAGGVVAADALDPTGLSDVSGVGAAIGAIAGRRLAMTAAAEEKGATTTLLVAITPDTIHVLNGDTHGRLASEFASFNRATVDHKIKKVGLMRYLTITDTDSDASIELVGSVAWIAQNAQGDKVVFDLLAVNHHD